MKVSFSAAKFLPWLRLPRRETNGAVPPPRSATALAWDRRPRIERHVLDGGPSVPPFVMEMEISPRRRRAEPWE